MTSRVTEQESFWEGEFGDDYINRNSSDRFISANIAHFSEIFKDVPDVNSLFEFGCNIGLNLSAVKQLFPHCELGGVDINSRAIKIAKERCDASITEGSIFDVRLDRDYDVSMTKGVLIHINPEYLNVVYEKLYTCSSKYILIMEYYNPTPVEIDYHGNSGRLYKRDFAREIFYNVML